MLESEACHLMYRNALVFRWMVLIEPIEYEVKMKFSSTSEHIPILPNARCRLDILRELFAFKTTVNLLNVTCLFVRFVC